MRTRYWNIGKIADKLRGVDKPYALSWGEWKQWKIDAKTKHPFRFWFVETFLSKLQDVVMWIPGKIYSAKYYMINRWVDQSHALVAHPKHVKPGQYMDLSDRMLYCLFDELVDFVEIEKAYCGYRWDVGKSKKLKWWQGGVWRTRTWRSPEDGIAHLKWESTLTDEEYIEDKSQAKLTPQAMAAIEILSLYQWYTETRANRPDPYDASGWSDFCNDKRERGIGFLEEDPDENVDEKKRILDDCSRIEREYMDEDTDMLIRLIKIRAQLWS